VYYKTKLSANDTNYRDIVWNKADTITSTDDEGFSDQEVEVTDLPTFDIVAVKLVLRANTSVNPPLVKDLIVIANA